MVYWLEPHPTHNPLEIPIKLHTFIYFIANLHLSSEFPMTLQWVCQDILWNPRALALVST